MAATNVLLPSHVISLWEFLAFSEQYKEAQTHPRRRPGMTIRAFPCHPRLENVTRSLSQCCI